MDDWRQVERRRNGGGWSMLKEIIGTIIGCLPFVIMAIAWGVHVESNVAVNSAQIRSLQEQRVEISQKLDHIGDRLDQIGRDVSTAAARIRP